MTFPAGGHSESIDALASMLGRQSDRLRAAQRRLEEIRGEGWAADGLVQVEVSHTGALAGLSIDPRALRLGADRLAEAILDAASEAALDLGERSEELMRPLIAELMRTDPRARGLPEDPGPDAPGVEEILDTLREARRRLED